LANQIEGVRVRKQSLPPGRAQAQCREECGHCRWIALQQCRQAQGAADRKEITAEQGQGRVGFGFAGQPLAKLPADLGQEVERHAAVRQVTKHLLGRPNIAQPPAAKLLSRQMRRIQDANKRTNLHARPS
jgi:hypothetical protein